MIGLNKHFDGGLDHILGRKTGPTLLMHHALRKLAGSWALRSIIMRAPFSTIEFPDK